MRCGLLLALAACTSEQSPWPPPQLDPLPDDPRLGDVLHDRSGELGALVQVTANGDDVFVAIGGYNEPPKVYRIPFAGSPVQLPDRPGSLAQDAFGVSWTPGTCMLGNAFWDGNAWTVIPYPPAPVDAGERWIARSPSDVLVGNYHWNGVSWRGFVVRGTFGPWDASGIREVWAEQASICTSVVNLALMTTTAPICMATGGAPGTVRDAHNGSVDDFMVLGDFGPTNVYRFHAGTWTAGDDVGIDSRLSPAPGATKARVTTPDPMLNFHERPAIREIEAGQVTRELVPTYDAVLNCSCDRNADPACPCATGLIYPSIVFDREDAHGMIVTQRDIDARTKIYVRNFTPPLAESPFKP